MHTVTANYIKSQQEMDLATHGSLVQNGRMKLKEHQMRFPNNLMCIQLFSHSPFTYIPILLMFLQLPNILILK